MSDPTYITTPIGRLVQGDPSVVREALYEGKKQLSQTTGQPKQECYFAVAFPKSEPSTAELWAQIAAVAQTRFPQGVPQGFNYKVMDGDHPDYALNEGFQGCLVVKFKGGFAPKLTRRDGSTFVQAPPELFKRGHYVRVAFSAAYNEQKGDKAGLYINPQIVNWEAYGEEIQGGVDAATAFAQPAALPPGASTAPVGGAVPMPGQAPPAPPANPALPGAPAAPTAPPALPGAPAGHRVQPAKDWLNGPGATQAPALPGAPPAPPVPPAPPAPPAGPVMLPAANGTPYESWVASGWTDAQLITAGYMAPR